MIHTYLCLLVTLSTRLLQSPTTTLPHSHLAPSNAFHSVVSVFASLSPFSNYTSWTITHSSAHSHKHASTPSSFPFCFQITLTSCDVLVPPPMQRHRTSSYKAPIVSSLLSSISLHQQGLCTLSLSRTTAVFSMLWIRRHLA